MIENRRTRSEDYLAAVESICEDNDLERAPTGAIAQQIRVSKGTVSSVLKELAVAGLVDLIPYEGAKLTSKGDRSARRIVRRYRLLELFLGHTLGVGWDTVAAEAWRLEPGASDALIERIDSFLESPEYDPHGDPIPRIDGSVPQRIVMPITAHSAGTTVVVRRVRDQSAETLRYLAATGVTVGAKVVINDISVEGGVVVLETDVGTKAIGHDVALQIFVQPDSEVDDARA